MARSAVRSLENTINHLVNSSRISIVSPSQEILDSAQYWVESVRELLEELDSMRESIIESERRKAFEVQVAAAARKLEDVIEYHVSNQFLSQSQESQLAAGDDDEQLGFIFSLDLQELRPDIDCFTEKVEKMMKLFKLLFAEEDDICSLMRDLAGDESDMYLFKKYRGIRDGLINLCATRAASILRTNKEKCIKRLEKLLPEKGDDDDDDDDVSSRTDFAGSDSDEDETPYGRDSDEDETPYQYREIRDLVINVCATRVASIFGMNKEKYIKELENLLPEEVDDDGVVVVSSTTDFAGSDSVMDSLMDVPYQYQKIIMCGLMNWWITNAASIFGMEEEECINEVDSPPMPQEEDDDDGGAASSATAFGGNKLKMVGLSDEFREIRDKLLGGHISGVLVIIGMAGIGKTTFAKKIFEDPFILRNFECHAFVRLGQKYHVKKILQAILAQVNPDSDKKHMEGDNEALSKCLRRTLKGRKYLIVLDDVWDTSIKSDFRKTFPYEDNGSQIMVTTRLEQVTTSLNVYSTYHMRFLNKEESWDLLCATAFANEVCPPQLEKAGKKIAENCEGLPLLIVTVANLLSKALKTPEYWNKVAANKENSVFIDAYDQISMVLSPSYNNLPEYIKPFFLYMATFPQNYEVSLSRLINLWNAEGSLDVGYKYVQDTVEDCLQHLVSCNLVLALKRSRFRNKLKACSLHSVFWHLCKKEARNNKFLHIFNSYSDASAEGIKSMRCLSIYKNILFSIKEVYNSMASISTARLLLCTGPHHRYQVPMCFRLRLLRILDALTIHFYEFPMEVLKLVHLRYLALTCNGNLPPSISNLWNLQCLIVHQYLSIKSSVVESYLPMETWYLQELNYLQIMGRNLPCPPRGVVLQNLLTLLDVGAHSCTKSVLESIPNLDKLRVQIELAPDATGPLSCFDHISVLNKLKSLQYVIVNPTLSSEIVAPPSHLFIFSSSLRKLTLSGFGYPWKDMNKIANLPSLEVLKLQCYAFRGERWEAEEHMFPRLKYLLIEDTDLVQWTAGYENFAMLFWLTIKNCYRLQHIPKISSVQEIQLVDCNPLAMTCAKQMEHDDCHVYVDSSFFA